LFKRKANLLNKNFEIIKKTFIFLFHKFGVMNDKNLYIFLSQINDKVTRLNVTEIMNFRNMLHLNYENTLLKIYNNLILKELKSLRNEFKFFQINEIASPIPYRKQFIETSRFYIAKRTFLTQINFVVLSWPNTKIFF
jgi:hypothetical protein